MIAKRIELATAVGLLSFATACSSHARTFAPNSGARSEPEVQSGPHVGKGQSDESDGATAGSREASSLTSLPETSFEPPSPQADAGIAVALLASKCVGTKLNLDDEDLRYETCRVPAASKPNSAPPPAALPFVAPVSTVRIGGTAALTLTMTNVSKAPLRVVLDATLCRADRVEVYDMGGRRVDVDADCMSGMSCGGPLFAVDLSPGGTADEQISYHAVTHCAGADARVPKPFPPGKYKLRVFSRLRDGADYRYAETALVVTR